MYFLAIDTSTNSGGVAVGRNAEVIGVAMVKAPLRYSDQVVYYIDFLLHHLDLQIEQVDCFVVAHGPGSFTGLRIGLATVKGFCQNLGKPALGISTLAALAYRFRHVAHKVAPMIDARRQQIYGAVFDCREDGVDPISPEQVLPPAKWLQCLPPQEKYLFVGDAAQMYSQTVRAVRPEALPLRTDNSILSELCLLGYHRFLNGESCSAEQLKANYVRPPDAEMARIECD